MFFSPSNITSCNNLSFYDEELPEEGRNHNLELHISINFKEDALSNELVDIGSSLNVLPKSTLTRLSYQGAPMRYRGVIVKAFDGSRKTFIGEVDLLVKIGPSDFQITFQVWPCPRWMWMKENGQCKCAFLDCHVVSSFMMVDRYGSAFGFNGAWNFAGPNREELGFGCTVLAGCFVAILARCYEPHDVLQVTLVAGKVFRLMQVPVPVCLVHSSSCMLFMSFCSRYALDGRIAYVAGCIAYELQNLIPGPEASVFGLARSHIAMVVFEAWFALMSRELGQVKLVCKFVMVGCTIAGSLFQCLVFAAEWLLTACCDLLLARLDCCGKLVQLGNFRSWLHGVDKQDFMTTKIDHEASCLIGQSKIKKKDMEDQGQA
ncbi:hypothetical protein KIW84_066433 [Lathyrus oleraceus]|uniref:Uncharacterized protein n=1 Tax=Pisum sativum TaxID=3888 RepID=A0A9D4WFS4_PEA|nr:hypothetical protein KIW84_066433 [Pisum sativum]